MMILKVENLKKYYVAGGYTIKAVDGINLEVEAGEFVAIIGRSGSGKSTLLHLIGGLEIPTAGRILYSGKELALSSQEAITIFRRRNIGFIFQDYNLVPILNVYENIILPLELDGETINEEFINDIIKSLELEEKINVLPNQLSGGQQQRVAIARALASKPQLILADEPTGNLDSQTSADVMGLLKEMTNKFNQTLIMITHNEEIAQLADRIIQIEDGCIREEMVGEVVD